MLFYLCSVMNFSNSSLQQIFLWFLLSKTLPQTGHVFALFFSLFGFIKVFLRFLLLYLALQLKEQNLELNSFGKNSIPQFIAECGVERYSSSPSQPWFTPTCFLSSSRMMARSSSSGTWRIRSQFLKITSSGPSILAVSW